MMQQLLLVATALFALAQAMPHRSTLGVVRSRPSLDEVLSSYLQAAQRRQKPLYGYPEYQPSYQQEYISHRPRRIQQASLDPMIQYLANQEQDYANYDGIQPYMGDQMYNDNAGTWYDDNAAVDPSYELNNGFLKGEPSDQDIALARLMLDHMAGKYSLEDLETLEREARIEEDTENQLRTLALKQAQHKKSGSLPLIGSPAPRSNLRHLGLSTTKSRLGSSKAPSDTLKSISQRRGQKEEPVMVPATSVRKPIFVQHLESEQKKSLTEENKVENSIAASSPTPSKPLTSEEDCEPVSNPETGVVEVVRVGDSKRPPCAKKSSPSSKASAYFQPAYDVLKKYLDQERQARVRADEELLESKQKRFVKQPSDSLVQQLNSLKKIVA